MTWTRSQTRIPAPAGEALDAWIYLPDGPGPHPTVVMAHGIGGIKAAGLAPFAERFADDGYLAVVFDYRHWGESSGQPREMLSVTRQREDYRTVLSWVRSHPAADPDRVFAWGTSFAGMHIVELAAGEDGLAGAIAQVPLVDGPAALTRVNPIRGLRLALAGIMDLLGAKLGRAPRYVPISVAPGDFGLIATEDAMRGYQRLHPDEGEWPNHITARSLLDFTVRRPIRRARQARCPLLMVVAEHDTMAPTRPALAVATRAPNGELYRSRGGHYDVYAGGLDHENTLQVELDFLRRHSRLPQPAVTSTPSPRSDSR